MEKNQILAISEQQIAKNNNNTFSNELSTAPELENDTEGKILAKTVDYCLKEQKVATFKDLDKIASIVKKRTKSSIQSMFGNVVIYNSSNNLIVQYTKNDTQDLSKVNTTKILVGKNNKIEGKSKTYTMIKDQSNNDNYLEKELSSCEIDNMDSFSIKNANNEEIALYKNMKICQSLLGPIIDKLGKKVNINTSNELDSMFTRPSDSDNKQDLNTHKKI